jgi:hypothetical protein
VTSRYHVSTALPTVLSSALGASGNPSVISLPGTWPASYPFCVLLDWANSGFFAPGTFAPTWGSSGNTWSGNYWYDGASAAQVVSAPS